MLHVSIKIPVAFNGPGILASVLLFECLSVWPQNIAIVAWCITCGTRQRLLMQLCVFFRQLGITDRNKCLLHVFIRKCKLISQGVKGKLAVNGANNSAKYGSGFKNNPHVPLFGRNNMAQKAIPARKAIRPFQKDNDKAALFRKVLYYHVSSPNLAVSRTGKKNYAAFAIKCSVKEVAL